MLEFIFAMPHTYKAKLVKDRLQWLGESPNQNDPIDVYVTLAESASSDSEPQSGQAMADALQEVADRGGLTDIPDPVAWQREVREDRPLSGRDD
jgi:hypothetical protein